MKRNTWYYNENLKPQGPLSLEQIRERIQRGEVGPFDLICQDGDNWRPACEWGVFEAQLFPAVQAYVPGQDVALDEKEWVLLVVGDDGRSVLQEGPYSVREIQEGLRTGSISGHQHVWKSGLTGWCRVQDRPEFSISVNLARP